jgi:uncharacterized protein (UPF0332 family)
MTDRETLLRYRMKQAEETLADAEAMAKGELSPRSIVNRAYYAMFYAVLGLFLKTNVTLKTSKHPGIISMFDQIFILSGKMDKQFSKSLHKMFNSRQVADYKELVEVSSEEAEDALEAARRFIERSKRLFRSSRNSLETYQRPRYNPTGV